MQCSTCSRFGKIIRVKIHSCALSRDFLVLFWSYCTHALILQNKAWFSVIWLTCFLLILHFLLYVFCRVFLTNWCRQNENSRQTTQTTQGLWIIGGVWIYLLRIQTSPWADEEHFWLQTLWLSSNAHRNNLKEKFKADNLLKVNFFL